MRAVIRLIVAALELLIEILRVFARGYFERIAEVLLDIAVRPVARNWRRLHDWVGRNTGLPLLAIPICILLAMVLLAAAFVAIVVIGQAIF